MFWRGQIGCFDENRHEAIGNSKKTKAVGFALCAMVFALCLPVWAQQPKKVYRIGYISARNEIGRNEDAFRKRFHELGYVEGQNTFIDWRFASSNTSRFPDFAAELVRLKADAIVGQGVGATVAAKHATSTIPIVMSNADDDPVRLGLIDSLVRPGGNVTGFISISTELAGKRLELFNETFPKATRIAILSRPVSQSSVAASHVRETEVAARALGIKLYSLEVRGAEDLENAFRTARKVAEALIVVAVAGMINDRDRILALAVKKGDKVDTKCVSLRLNINVRKSQRIAHGRDRPSSGPRTTSVGSPRISL